MLQGSPSRQDNPLNPQVLVPIADGSEEIEAVTLVDVLRRAGASVTVASCNPGDGLTVTCSRGVKIVADTGIRALKPQGWDMIAIPGGMPGATHLRDCESLTRLLQAQQEAGAWIAAICAAPAVVLGHHGFLHGKTATCHPGFRGQLAAAQASAASVVVDGRVITSQGPGTAMAFALELASALFGQEKAANLAEPMVIRHAPG